MVRDNYRNLQEGKRLMKNWIDPEDEIIRGRRKRTEPKPKIKKANHKHDYTDGLCKVCNKTRG